MYGYLAVASNALVSAWNKMIYFTKLAFLTAIIHLSLGQECGLPKELVLNSYLNKSEPAKLDPLSMPFHAKIRVGTKSCHGYFVDSYNPKLRESEVLTTPDCVPRSTDPATVKVNNIAAHSIKVNAITPHLIHIKLDPRSIVDKRQLPCRYMPDRNIITNESSCLVIEATSDGGMTAKHADFFDDCDDSFLEGNKDAFVMTCVRDRNSSTSAGTSSSIICLENGRWYLTHMKDRQTSGFALYMDLGYALHGSYL
ncbi:hypothetical protein TTRE_0000033401 [Trichuris trichiura]|uniref:Trypsin domain containing protein n=1 Tax=Trichuris trichiura TaxID=36087 RepID=A0A077Z0D5_TRITR|nr:hypothetical protein TTRE_0000033401 [Trichuris trichiura]